MRDIGYYMPELMQAQAWPLLRAVILNVPGRTFYTDPGPLLKSQFLRIINKQVEQDSDMYTTFLMLKIMFFCIEAKQIKDVGAKYLQTSRILSYKLE